MNNNIVSMINDIVPDMDADDISFLLGKLSESKTTSKDIANLLIKLKFEFSESLAEHKEALVEQQKMRSNLQKEIGKYHIKLKNYRMRQEQRLIDYCRNNYVFNPSKLPIDLQPIFNSLKSQGRVTKSIIGRYQISTK